MKNPIYCSVTNEKITNQGYFITSEERYIKNDVDVPKYLREQGVDDENEISDDFLINEALELGEIELVKVIASFSEELSLLKQNITKEFNHKINSLEQGTALLLIGDNEIIPANEVESFMDKLTELFEDNDELMDSYNELPFGIYHDDNDMIEYKIIGFSNINQSIHVHINNNYEEKYMCLEMSYFDISIETLSEIVDLF